MPLLLNIALTILGAAISARPGPSLRVLLDTPVPEHMRWTQDVRWASSDEMFLTAGRGGVYRLPVRKPLPNGELVIPGENTRGGFFFSSRLARADQFLITASPFAALAWRDLRKQRTAAVDATHAFAMIVDFDAYGDEIIILGADRDEKGRWAPEGAIAWRGSLGVGLADLHPVHYSTSGPKVPNMNNCASLETGAVRFMSDGSYVILPGVEPGVFLYDASTRLKRTWPTEGLGFADRCRLSYGEGLEYSKNAGLRERWVNQNTIVDDIVPLPSGPGLILRSFDKKEKRVTWTLMLLEMSGKTRKISIPVTSSSPLARARADVRGDAMLMLILQYGPLDRPPPEPPRIVHLKLPGLK